MHRILLATLTIAPLAPALRAEGASYRPDDDGFRQTARPFLERHCVGCHGPEKQKGKFRVDEHLPNAFADLLAAEKWGEVLDAVNSHEMPPEDEPQPDPADAAAFADWVAGELARAEVSSRPPRVVLRRLNRAEYVNTIRDLLGVEVDPDRFPADPPAGGFDNIGRALTLSPLHLELYYEAAREIVASAILPAGTARPEPIKWRFEFEEDLEGNDRTWLRRDGQRVLLNSGNNKKDGAFVVMRTEGWDKGAGFREFRPPHDGEYIIRFRASARVPAREQVVEAARQILSARDAKEAKEKGRPYDPDEVEEHLPHFREEPMYDYGPPRVRVTVTRGGQPANVAEFDVATRFPDAAIHEIRTPFTTEKSGIQLLNVYEVPRVLENFWFQGHDEFPRPELLLDWIELEGPVYDQWPPASHTRLFAELPAGTDWDREEARAVVQRFMRLAWRRPVTDPELDAKLALFDAARADGAGFLAAVQPALVAVLTSPRFLYLAEPSTDPRPLDSHELATRLSYFLWSSLPDEALFATAESGALREPAALIAQANRLLADARHEAFCENFAGQWLDLRKIGANPPAPDLFPRYDRHLEESIAAESVGFFREILNNDLSVLNFIRSDFVTINERLARFYGIPGVRGDHIRKVPVAPDVHRGGIVTQASVLSVTSNGTRTSPVVRGTWILKNLLGTDPGLPVANAGEIAPKVSGIDKATVRQRLEVHRTLAQCARCHNKIDPLGFALENFNAAGEWRNKEGFGYKGRIGRDDPDIDASARLPDGTRFVGVAGLQDVLLEREDLFLRCLAQKLFTYALGRELGYSDKAHLDAAVAHMKANGRTLRSLIHFIVTSDPFLTK